MSKEIYISTTPHETRLAIVEDEQLAEIYYERENEYTLAGSIYNGKVTRVLPGMQSAFVDVGLERDAFLYVTDFMEEQGESDEFESDGQSRRPAQGGGERERRGGGQRQGDRGRREGAKADGSETVSFDEPIAPRPAAPRSAEQGSEGEGQGSRQWRGRRGRRRGRGGSRDASATPETGEATAGYEPAQGYDDEGASSWMSEPVPSLEASSAIEIDLGAEPQAPGGYGDRGGYGERRGDRGRGRGRERGRDRGRDGDRGSREERPAYGYSSYGSEEESAPAGEPIVLPGESIRKYRDPAEVAAEDAERAARAPKVEVLQPSTPELKIEGWDGGAVLPGESLSRRRGRGGESAAPSRAVPAPAASFASAEPELTPDGHTTEELHSTAEAVQTAGSVTPLPDAEDVAASAAPEETGGLTQVPEAVHAAAETEQQTATTAPAEAGEYEPAEGESASLEGGDGRTYLRAETPVADSGNEDVSAQGVEDSHDRTTYDLDSSDDASPANAASEHEFTTLEPSGTMLSERVSEDGSAAKAHTVQDTAEQDATAEPKLDFVAEVQPAEQPETPPATAATVDGNSVLPALHAYGDGDLHEEEIDGDEYEFDAAIASLDEYEIAEYEEETLESNGDEYDEAGDADERRTPVLGEDEQDEEVAYAGGFTADDFGGEPAEDEEEESSSTGAGSSERSRRGGLPRRGSRPQRGGSRDRGRGRKSMQTTDLPAINDLLKPGQEILVQIAKEPIAKKGARITSHIALPGRFLVFMPTVNHTGVSRKISSDEERRRLKAILLSEKGDAQGGFIVRTAAEGASEEELRNDLRFLIHLWEDIKARSESSKSPALIYHDLNLIERILRDQVTDNFSAIWVDTEAEYERVLRFLQRFQPSLVRRVKLYTKETPLYEHFGVTAEIEKALKSKVWLKSGGSIVINQTEALVAIDINTGKYVGKTARLEDTILKTNLDAIPEIVRQIRLRDLGGIIVIDFIDMDERKNRAKVLQALEDELRTDRAPSKVLPFNDFGLVIMTRKRVKQSLERTLCIPDPVTEGTGMIKSPVTVANEIYVEMRRMYRHIEKGDIMLRVHPEVVKQLKSNGGKRLQELEEMTHKTILVKSDPALSPEQFDIH